MNKTKIEWCKYTWNPVVGCLGICPYCYAAKIWKRFHKKVYPGMESFQDIWWNQKEFEKPFPRKPSMIFVGSMSDVVYWKKIHLHKIFEKIENEGKNHVFMFLSNRLKAWELYRDTRFPENSWLGMTATGIDMEKYPRLINRVNNNIRFLSIEPILTDFNPDDCTRFLKSFDWIIVGCMTGKSKGKAFYPYVSTISKLRVFCYENKIALFEKDNIKYHYKLEAQPKELFEIDDNDRRRRFPEVKLCS